MSTETQELTREDLQKMWDEEVAGETPAAETPPQPPATRSGEAENLQDDAGGQPAANDEAEPPLPQDPMDEIRARLGVLDRLEQRVRNTEGHIGGLTSELGTFRKELKAAATAAAATAPGAAPNQTQIAAAAKNLAKWESLKSDFPEWADAIDERLGANVQPKVNVDEIRQQVAAELTPRLKAEIEASMEPRLVDVAHRGWRMLVNTPDFVQWINAQPENVRQLAASPKADDAIDLLDRYKETRKVLPKTSEEIAAERQARLRQAANTPRGQGANTPRRSADDMTDEEYWAYLAKQGVSR